MRFMAVRVIAAAAVVIVVAVALAAALLFFIFNRLTDDGSGASARRVERSDRRDDRPAVEQEVRLVGIVPSPRIVRLDAPGDSQRLSVTGYYSDRSEGPLDGGTDATVSYRSSDPSVVQVDSRGVFTGVKTGGADVIVTYDDLTATVPVFVWGPMRSVPPFDPERVLEVADDGSAILLNRVMVEMEPGYDSGDADEVAAQIGGRVVFEYRTFPGYLVEFDGRTEGDLSEALVALQNDGRVAAAYPDLLMVGDQQGTGATIETLNLDNDRGDAYLDAGMEYAWTTLGIVEMLNPVTIGIIDLGFTTETGDPDVDAILTAEFDYDRIDFRFGQGNWMDPEHGTGVASVILAQNNRNAADPRSFSGVLTSIDGIEHNTVFYSAPNGFRHSGSRFTSALEDMILYKNQIDVVNISMGYRCEVFTFDQCPGVLPTPGPWFQPWRSRWKDLMRAMPEVVFVFAGDNKATDTTGQYPADLAPELPNGITVGATHKGNRAWFSSFGPAITVGAPGKWVWVVDPEHGYLYASGTSAAAPMVTGTAAMLRALDPRLSAADIKQILVATGGAHTVCTVTQNENIVDPCPPEDREVWPILDAGEAVSSLLWPSVDANIDLPEDHVVQGTVDDYVELTIPVANTGLRDWNFHLGGEARLDSEDKKLTYKIDPVQNVVPAGKSHPFKLGFSLDQAGDWTVELKLYRNPELTSSPDSEELRLRVLPIHADLPRWESVSAGGWHTCAVDADLASVCWGFNEDTFYNYTGQAVPPGGSFRSVSAGLLHNCAIRTDQSLACWGDDSEYQSDPPRGEFRSVSAGLYHTCAVDTDYYVECWGSNQYGKSAPPDGEFLSVSAGGSHTCGVRLGGSVECWGYDLRGQATPPDGPFTEVSAGLAHTCGLRRNGSVVCWGHGDDRRLEVPEGQFSSISVGFEHSCGLKTDGSVVCWGANRLGESTDPEGRFFSVSAGVSHNCGIRTDGSVSCWGDNHHGRATPPGGAAVVDSVDGPASAQQSPQNENTQTEQGSATGYASVSAGFQHTCGLKTDGNVVCWGFNRNLRGFYTGQSDPPQDTFVSISVGDFHSCGLTTDGMVECWGDDEEGQSSPPGGRFTAVSAGEYHTCGLRPAGSVECWGQYHSGRIEPEGQFASISAGGDHTCGILIDGAVTCWGSDEHGKATPPDGHFISVSAGDRNTCGLRAVQSIECWGSDGYLQSSAPNGSFASVSAGGKHSCAVTTNGAVDCWGASNAVVYEPETGKFRSVSAGTFHACGIKFDGSVACWGSNHHGMATPPGGPSDAKAYVLVSAGNFNSCGLTTKSFLDCWGDVETGVNSPPEGAFDSVSVGENHACGVKVDGSVACWGDGRTGKANPPDGEFRSVTAGSHRTCGVKTDGSIACWDRDGSFGASAPKGSFVSVAVGLSHACGLREDGTVACWGSIHLDPGPLDSPDGVFTAVSSGALHICGLRTNGSVHCWGDDQWRQVQSTPADDTFTSISAGSFHTCGAKSDGSIVCWGENSSKSWPPDGPFSLVTAGGHHSCGIREGGELVCWGGNVYGQAAPPRGSHVKPAVPAKALPPTTAPRPGPTAAPEPAAIPSP